MILKLCFCIHIPATIKKFYRSTNILGNDKKFEVALDQRKLKTPSGKVLEIPSKPLAIAVATEWDSQQDTINRSQMHLVRFILQYKSFNNLFGIERFLIIKASFRQRYVTQFWTIQINLTTNR